MSKPLRAHDLGKKRSLVPSDLDISNALNVAVDLQPMSPDHERMARYTIRVLIPTVRKLIEDTVRAVEMNQAENGG